MNLLHLKKKLEVMSLTNQIEIYRIFHNNKVPITENKNGSFINISNVPIKVLTEIEKYVNYIESQEHHLDSIETQQKQIESNFFNQSSQSN